MRFLVLGTDTRKPNAQCLTVLIYQPRDKQRKEVKDSSGMSIVYSYSFFAVFPKFEYRESKNSFVPMLM